MSGKRVAVVTGSNKGIGLAIVEGLCKQFDGDVILTARNVDLGNEAVNSLKSKGLNPIFHQLDICDKASIEKLRDFLKKEYGGLDVLINNAGMAYKGSTTAPPGEQAEVTCRTNFTGTLNVCEILFPLLRTNARVAHLSSFTVQMVFPKCSKEVQARFQDKSLTMPGLVALVQEFVDAAKAGDHIKKGFPSSTYAFSKVAVTLMTFIQHREMLKDPREGILINCCCPGYVKTDMTSQGGNKTVDEGYAIVEGLCKQFDGDVILTARNVDLGNEAVKELKSKGLNPIFHQLDICDKPSIEKLRDFLKKEYGGLDVLINNAGMAYKGSSTAPPGEQAEVTCRTNFTGTLDVCELLFPLLRPNARVAHLSSFTVQMAFPKCSKEVQARFQDKSLTMPGLVSLVQEFVDAAKAGKHIEKGFPSSTYAFSKVAVTLMTFIQHREMLKDSREGILINCCCPGSVATDMSSHRGRTSIFQGADTPIYLALLPAGTKSPNGEFVAERKIEDWTKMTRKL